MILLLELGKIEAEDEKNRHYFRIENAETLEMA